MKAIDVRTSLKVYTMTKEEAGEWIRSRRVTLPARFNGKRVDYVGAKEKDFFRKLTEAELDVEDCQPVVVCIED